MLSLLNFLMCDRPRNELQNKCMDTLSMSHILQLLETEATQRFNCVLKAGALSIF